MAKSIGLARPYAKAVFEVAKSSGSLEKWSSLLSALSVILSEKRVISLIENPNKSSESRFNLIESLCKDWFFEEGKNFFLLLDKNKRLSLLPIIALLFEEMKAKEESILKVSVATAFPVDEKDSSLLKRMLENKFKQDVEVEHKIQPEIIGGALININDTVIDASILGQLNKLHDSLRA